MTTTYQRCTSRRGRTNAAILLAAAATVAGVVGTAAPANAADQYIALALGYVNENPPVTMAGGSSIAGTQDAAAQGALTNCVNNGGSHCVTVVIGTLVLAVGVLPASSAVTGPPHPARANSRTILRAETAPARRRDSAMTRAS